jgi:ferrous iron transport protein A
MKGMEEAPMNTLSLAGPAIMPVTALDTTLDQLEPGESGVIMDVDTSRPLGRRLLDVGIAPGVSTRVVRRAPLGDPIEISLPDTLVSLRSYEAALVSVHLIS